MTTTPTPDEVDVDDVIDLELLASELTKRQAAIEADKERIEEIKAILRDRLPVGTHPAGPYRVQVKAGARRLDTTALEHDFPVTAHPELYSARPDTAKVKHHIAPSALATYYVEGQPTVVVQ